MNRYIYEEICFHVDYDVFTSHIFALDAAVTLSVARLQIVSDIRSRASLIVCNSRLL